MKRLLLLFFLLLITGSYAQNQTYLTFEFMKVDNDQESFYRETEDFWEKIHQQRISSGDIVGWDLWQLLPGGEDQGYQYLTVTVFDDPLKMMHAGDGIMESARMAYPDLSDEEIEKRINMAGDSRDLAVRLFLVIVDQTNDNFEMKPGMIAAMDIMKAKNDDYDSYEKAESETFKPWHQKIVDAGAKGDWQLLRVMIPQGTDVYATHLTVNMFKDYDQFLKAMNFDAQMGPDFQKKAATGAATRDLKYTYLASLVKMVR